VQYDEFKVELPDSTPRHSALLQSYRIPKKYARAVEVACRRGAQGKNLLQEVTHLPPLGHCGEWSGRVTNLHLARRP
jgi:hypothetical protein